MKIAERMPAGPLNSSTLTDKVVDVAVGAYVKAIVGVDTTKVDLDREKAESTLGRIKAATYAPFYHTVTGWLAGGAVGVLETLTDGPLKQTVAKTRGNLIGAAVGFVRGVNEAAETLKGNDSADEPTS